MNAQPDYDTRDREAKEAAWTETQCAGIPFTDPAAALRFVLAGNAYFTLRSRKTGARYTYRVSAVESADGGQQVLFGGRQVALPQRWFVGLLVGPENGSDYAYLGLIEADRSFRLTRKSRMTAESLPVKALSYALAHLKLGAIPEQLEIWHEGRCGRCGRMLTVPGSIAAGLGPECAGRMGL